MKKLCRILIPGAFDGAICFLLFTYQVQAVRESICSVSLILGKPRMLMFLSISRTCVSMVATPAEPLVCRW